MVLKAVESINYEPTNSSLYFLSSNCRPGDYHGLNTDTQV